MSEVGLPVSVEDSRGRILTGIEVDPNSLKETMARHAPSDAPEPTVTSEAAPEPIRDDQGRFTSTADAAPDGVAAPTATDSAAAGTPEPAAAAEAAPVDMPPEGKPKGRAKTKDDAIERATYYRREAERQRDEERTRAAKLEAELAQLKTGAKPAAAEPPAPTTGAFPSEDEYFAQNPGAPYSAYFDAKLQHTLKVERESWRREQDQQLVERQVSDQLTALHTRTVQKYPDFDALVQEGLASGLRLSPSLSRALLRHPDQAIDWSYQIVKSPELAARLSRLADADPTALGLELAALSRPASAPTAQERRPVTSTAPAPIQPIAGSAATNAPSLQELADKSGDDYDSSGYRERRAAERKAAGRR